jgi:hypothetical protein
MKFWVQALGLWRERARNTMTDNNTAIPVRRRDRWTWANESFTALADLVKLLDNGSEILSATRELLLTANNQDTCCHVISTRVNDEELEHAVTLM